MVNSLLQLRAVTPTSKPNIRPQLDVVWIEMNNLTDWLDWVAKNRAINRALVRLRIGRLIDHAGLRVKA